MTAFSRQNFVQSREVDHISLRHLGGSTLNGAMLNASEMAVPDLIFKWFSAEVSNTSITSCFTPPPTPLTHKPMLLSFWPVSSDSSWLTAAHYKQINYVVRDTGVSNCLAANTFRVVYTSVTG